jgi:hypothetical protein
MKNDKTNSRYTHLLFTGLAIIGPATSGCGQGDRAPEALEQTSVDLQLASDGAVDAGVASDGGTAVAQIQAYRDSFYEDSDVVYSFQSKFGETIDCIDFESVGSVKALRAQGKATPFDKPLTTLPQPASSVPPPNGASNLAFLGEPDVNGNPRRCPNGTALMTRPSVAQILAAGGLDSFLAQRAQLPKQSTEQYDCYYTTTPGAGWDHAAGYQDLNYAGLLKYTTLYNPILNNTGEHTLSQLWAITGNCENWSSGQNCPTGAVQSVEVGWMVGNGNPSQIPFLFAFITLDGYMIGGKSCYAGQGTALDGQPCCTANSKVKEGTDCWVPNPNTAQYPVDYVVNEQLGNANSFPTGQAPTEMAIQVWNGTPYGEDAWYVWINGNLIGGYYSSVFSGQMQTTGASYLQVGGEVYDSWPKNNHTTTQMGSGIPPAPGSGYGYEYTAYDRDVMYIDAQNNYHNASLSYINDTPAGEYDSTGVCGYEAGLFYALSTSLSAGGSGWGTYFYYGGGPGVY